MKTHVRIYLTHLIVLLLALGSFAIRAHCAESKEGDAPTTNPELKKQEEELKLQNSIADQRLRQQLFKMVEEKSRLELENGLAQQKLKAEIASLEAQIEKLTKQAALRDAERKAKQDAELADLRDKLEKLKLANEIASAELAAKTRELAQREQELRVRIVEFQAQRAELETQIAKLNTEIEQRERRDQLKNRVARDIQYTKEPFKNGVLTISDRRIALNGVITMTTADYVVERIDYFNNQNPEFPIFIVIDRSPGGSVMAGYKILKAMEGSPAPVYVVVKSYAASMAASIVTLAKKSYAYPNAIILHHQMSSGAYGNLTEQKEQIKEADEWWKRLASPIAAKMGISTDEFVRRMYQNRSTGDWKEFADAARKLKWVDEIVDTIREESFVKNPDFVARAAEKKPQQGQDGTTLQEETDSEGRRFVTLPRLDPLDCYYLYNPDRYYRLPR
jgi:ATP-dependent Clp protease protease subunit